MNRSRSTLDQADAGVASTQSGGPSHEETRGPGKWSAHAVVDASRRWGVFAVFVAMFAAFSVVNPGKFATSDNIETMVSNSASLTLAAVALTFVLALGHFDLSFAAVIGLAGAISVYSMNHWGAPTIVAVSLALVVGAIIGAANGLMVAVGRVPALIGTLAVGSAATGIEVSMMKQNTVYEGIRPSYVALTSKQVFGIPSALYVTVVVVLVVWFVLNYTVLGRRVHAIGSGEGAARLAGIRTRSVILSGFIITGLIAGFAGVVVTSQASSYYPDSGTPYLLPAFAAAFLGFSAVGGIRFDPLATFFGVLFTQVLATGLTIMDAPPWASNLSSGVVLAVAVLLVRKQSTR